MRVDITNIGDRQSGKTHLLLRNAFVEATAGKDVPYQADSRVVATETFRLAAQMAESSLWSSRVVKVVRTNGEERINFTHGGRILFGIGDGRGLTIDTHIIDGANSEPHITASRVIRSALR